MTTMTTPAKRILFSEWQAFSIVHNLGSSVISCYLRGLQTLLSLVITYKYYFYYFRVSYSSLCQIMGFCLEGVLEISQAERLILTSVHLLKSRYKTRKGRTLTKCD